MSYIKIKAPKHPRADKNEMIFEHDLIVEQQIGRLLNENESVHHINQVRNDNRPTNLLLVSNQDHEYIHKHIKRKRWHR